MSISHFDRSSFDHLGLVTEEEKPGEIWNEEAGQGVTDPRNSPLNIEWLRFAPDSPAREKLGDAPHIAYRVEDLQSELRDREVVIEPFDTTVGATVSFVEVEGVLVELIEYENPDEPGWAGRQ